MMTVNQSPSFSFEFFPPKTDKGCENLWSAVDSLAAAKPAFMTVTYGAGGSTREWTLETAISIQEKTGIPTAAHLTYLNMPKCDLFEIVDNLWERGIRHIVALRGDMPDDLSWPLDEDKEYFQFTSDFVAAIKDRHDFEISVGAYPETHPDALNPTADIDALKKKCDAGACRAITQFFFDNEVYYRFLDQVEKAGVTTPLVPGLLPIINFEKMLQFAGMCQASVPDWLHEKLEPVKDNHEEAQKIAAEILAEQCRDLSEHGVPHFHFYTLNKVDLPLAACHAVQKEKAA